MLILYLYRILILPLKKNFSHRLPLRAAGEVVDELVWGLAYHTLPTAGTTLPCSFLVSEPQVTLCFHEQNKQSFD